MDASLDTDILIHLYTANMESILFSLFDTLYLHDYLYHNELFKKAPDDVWERIEDDIESEKIVIVDFKFLENLGMQEVFSEILSEYCIAMDSGENNAYALGKTLGCHVLTTDDTKEFGPHDLLIKSVNSEIIPLAYYELFYLDFLMDVSLTVNDFLDNCQIVNTMLEHPQNLDYRIKKLLRRFGSNIAKKDRTILNKHLKIKTQDRVAKNQLINSMINDGYYH